MRPVHLLLLSLCSSQLALADAGADKVAEARRQVDDLEYETALKTLDAAERVEGNTRETVLELHRLRGIAFGTLGKDAKTRDSFRKLLMLEPAAVLPNDLPPRVMTPFFEARDWCERNGPLTFVPSAELEEGAAKWLVVTAQKDVLRLGRFVRFHVGDTVFDAPFEGVVARTPVPGPTVSWWAEVLSDRKAVLLALGTPESPRVDGLSREPGVAAPVAAVTTPVESPGGAWRRPVGGALLAAGAVAAGVGVAFGLMSTDARAQVTGATRDEHGRVTSLTQRDAAALEASAQTQATVANVLFVTGGVLAAGGLVLIIVGPDAAPVATLAPAAGGVVLSGSF